MKTNNKYNIDTPSLLIDRAKMEGNLQKMAERCNRLDIRLRPHIKTHKIPEIAAKQIQLSSNGIAVSKLGEAEVMLKAGIKDILVANEIIGEIKIRRLGTFLNQGDIKVCVDSIEGIRQLHNYLPSVAKPLKILIEINTGMDRCGVVSFSDIKRIHKEITASPNLSFEGLLSHSGHIYAAQNENEAQQIAIEEAEQMSLIARQLIMKGIKVNTISVGSTPASTYLEKLNGITEVRPGNYVFYDYIQVCLGVASIEDCALTVLATVISNPTKERVVIDAGSKALGLDKGAHSSQVTSGFGYVIEHPDSVIERLSEEHGILKVVDSSKYRIGEKVSIIPNHACAVTNLFDEAYLIEDNKPVAVWKIAARGKVK